MKKFIFIFALLAVFMMIGINFVCASTSEYTIDNFDYLEYEEEHMHQHESARDLEQFYSTSSIVYTVILCVTVVLFLVLTLLNKKVTKIYQIILLIILISYIVANILAVHFNKSMFAIIQTNLYVIVACISFGIIFGFITNTGIKTIIISSVPAICMLIFCTIGSIVTFNNFEYLLADIIVGFEYLISIEFITQIILIPKYVKLIKEKNISTSK